MILYPEEISLENIKGLAPDVNLLASRHLDLPVALGLVGVVLRVVGSLNGNLLIKHEDNEMVANKIFFQTSCPSARESFPFLQLRASTSFLGRKVFFGSHAFAALKLCLV